MKKVIPALFILLISLFAKAQQDTAWVYTYGGVQDDICNQIRYTYDKGYITIGTTNSCGHGNTDFYVIKTDSLCHKQWSAEYGGSLNEAGYSVAPTYDKGYAFVGYTDSYGNGGYDVYLVKTDSVGNVKWQKTYGGSDWDFGYSIKETPSDSGFIICGTTYSYGNGNGDVYVIKTDKNGDTLWTRTIGGTGYDVGNSVCVHSKTLYAIAGATTSIGTGDTNMYIVLINDSGRVLKDTVLGRTHTFVANSIEGSDDGGYLIYGYTDSIKSPGIPDQVLFKTDSMATFQWESIFTTPQTGIGKEAVLGVDGNIVSIGSYNSYGLGEFNVNMQHISSGGGWWMGGAAFGGTQYQYGNSVAVAANGNVVFAGITNSFGQGLFDVYLIRVKNDSLVSNYYLVNRYLDDSSCTPAAIPYVDVIQRGVKIYPNPIVSSAIIMVQGQIAENYHLVLYNSIGDCVIPDILVNAIGHGQSIGHIIKGSLSAGIYFYDLYNSNNSKVANGKLVIR